VIGLGLGLIPTTAKGLTVSGGGTVPVGDGNDIDIFWTAGAGVGLVPIADGNSASKSTLVGSGAPSTDEAHGVTRFSSPTLSLAGGTVGWTLKIDPAVTITSWQFSKNGALVGPVFLAGSVTIIAFGGGLPGVPNVDVAVAALDPSTPLTLTNFSIFVDQSLGLLDPDTVALLATEPLSGSPVAGIPTSITLDSATPMLDFTEADFPGLVTPLDTLVVVRGSIDGSPFAWTESVPEPSTFAVLATGCLGLLGFGWRQRPRRAA